MAPAWWCVNRVKFVPALHRALRDRLEYRRLRGGLTARVVLEPFQKSEAWSGCRGRRRWTARGQHGSILHLRQEESDGRRGMNTNFPIFPKPKMMDDLSSFVFPLGQLKWNLSTETRGWNWNSVGHKRVAVLFFFFPVCTVLVCF